jgi:hypothetical protein
VQEQGNVHGSAVAAQLGSSPVSLARAQAEPDYFAAADALMQHYLGLGCVSGTGHTILYQT